MDGYKGQTCDSVVNFTETALGKSAFVKCIDPGTNQQNAAFYAREMTQIMEDRATSRRIASVEESQAGCVADNTTTNMSAFAIIKLHYPKLLMVGCATHLSDLLSEDIFDSNNIPLMKTVVTEVKFCVKFVKNHGNVKKEYQIICDAPEPGEKKGTMLVLFPETRFLYADQMFYKFEKNIRYLERLLAHPRFDSEIARGIPINQIKRFKTLISGDVDDMNDLSINLNRSLIDMVCVIGN